MTAAGIGGMARSAPRVPPKQRGFAVIFGDRVLLLGLLLLPGHGDAAGTRGKGVWFVGGVVGRGCYPSVWGYQHADGGTPDDVGVMLALVLLWLRGGKVPYVGSAAVL